MTPKTLYAILFLALILSFTSAATAQDEGEEQLRIGLVVEHLGDHTLDEAALEAATNAFRRTRRFVIEERLPLDSVFQEKGLKGFILDEGGAIVESSGLDWIGIVSYCIDCTEGSTPVEVLSVHLIEVSSGQEVLTIESKPSTGDGSEVVPESGEKPSPVERIHAAGDRLYENLRRTLAPTGHVIQIPNDREVLVNLGTEDGLRVGDELEVFVRRGPIIHPVTGREIPGREVTVAQLEVVSLEARVAICRIRRVDGSFSVGAQVQTAGDRSGVFGRLFGRFAIGTSWARMPQFPWPPPRSSAEDVLPRELLNSGEGVQETMRAVDQRLRWALNASGYFRLGYYSVPGGFALVTRLEQIEDDGRPKAPPDRWSTETPRMAEFSLSAYLGALFRAPEGRYRVIVLVVTAVPFGQRAEAASATGAEAWLVSGLNQLPPRISKIEVHQDTAVTALIYEFERLDTADTASPVLPSKLQGREHLRQAGILQALEP